MTLLDGAVVDRITVEARQIHFGRVLLTVFASLFFAVGWVAAKTCQVLWLAVAWMFAAVKVGWQDARKPAARPMSL